MDIISNIIIGAIGSIVATLLIFLLSKFYRFGCKERIFYQLEMAFNYIYQIENHHSYITDYEIVIHCAEELHKCLFSIHQNIYPFSLPFKSTAKKLIRTLLYDSSKRCEYVMFVTIGYKGNNEKEVRLQKVEERFYNANVNDENISIVRIQLQLIKTLIEKKTIYQGIKECKINCDINNYEDLIDINSFKTESYNKPIQIKGLSRKKYKNIIKKEAISNK